MRDTTTVEKSKRKEDLDGPEKGVQGSARITLRVRLVRPNKVAGDTANAGVSISPEENGRTVAQTRNDPRKISPPSVDNNARPAVVWRLGAYNISNKAGGLDRNHQQSGVTVHDQDMPVSEKARLVT